MAKNYVAEGHNIPVTAPYDVASGAGCLVGSLFGVALTTAASGARVDIQTVGVWDLAKETGTGWSAGDLIYWDDANKRCDKTNTNKLIGVALETEGSSDTVGRVRLNGAFTS